MGRTTYYGTCLLCGKRSSRAGITRHLKSCVEAHPAGGGPGGHAADLVRLRVEGTYWPLYWIDVEMAGGRTLADLDLFLRTVWLECCGHLSAFTIDRLTFGEGHDAYDGDVRLREVLPEPGGRFDYEYDFGSTTHLTLRVVGWRRGAAGNDPVRLLARNEPPVWACARCTSPAEWLCSCCWIADDDAMFCQDHGVEHECGEEALLPVVDSPRMGVCAYGL